MKRFSTLFLKLILVLVAVTVLMGLIWFPKTEGRAVNLDLVSIYTDPFILYIYICSTPFFVGLYQAFKLLNLIDANKVFSKSAIKSLKIMKFASLSLVVFIALALMYIRFFVQGDDPAGPTGLGIVMMLVLFVTTAGIAVAQKLLQNAIDIKKENDLTI